MKKSEIIAALEGYTSQPVIIEITPNMEVNVYSKQENLHCIIIQRAQPSFEQMRPADLNARQRTFAWSIESNPLDLDHFDNENGLLEAVKMLMP